jgi:hypothetical protein
MVLVPDVAANVRAVDPEFRVGLVPRIVKLPYALSFPNEGAEYEYVPF